MNTTLPAGTTSGTTRVESEVVYIYHGTAPVYYPAPGGGTYCNTATCVHDHETPAPAEACSETLARVIASGRLPKWATLSNPI